MQLHSSTNIGSVRFFTEYDIAAVSKTNYINEPSSKNWMASNYFIWRHPQQKVF